MWKCGLFASAMVNGGIGHTFPDASSVIKRFSREGCANKSCAADVPIRSRCASNGLALVPRWGDGRDQATKLTGRELCYSFWMAINPSGWTGKNVSLSLSVRVGIEMYCLSTASRLIWPTKFGFAHDLLFFSFNCTNEAVLPYILLTYCWVMCLWCFLCLILRVADKPYELTCPIWRCVLAVTFPTITTTTKKGIPSATLTFKVSNNFFFVFETPQTAPACSALLLKRVFGCSAHRTMLRKLVPSKDESGTQRISSDCCLVSGEGGRGEGGPRSHYTYEETETPRAPWVG